MGNLRALRDKAARLGRGVGRSAPVVDDLPAWCRARGIVPVTLSPEQVVRRQPPRVLATPPHPSFEQRLERTISERVLVELPEARLSGPHGLLVLTDGEYVVESVYGRHHLDEDPGLRRRLPARERSRPGDYFSLIGKFSGNGNYFHWIHDGLFRLHGTTGHLPPDVKYLIPADLPAFARELLQIVGLRDEQLVAYSGEGVREYERLWFASLPPSGAEVPAAVDWFREQAFAASGPPRPVAGRRLYVSRRDAAHCRVVNEDELLPVLARHGVEVVSTSRMSVSEQVRIFGEAELIVAPHGAGMTNLMFAAEGCGIVEITEPEWATDGHAYVFWSLAETIGQSFSYMVGESVSRRDNPRANLRLSAGVLDRALSQLVG